VNHIEALLQFVGTELVSRNTVVQADDELLLSGLVDSLGVVRLIAHIEEQLGVKVPPEEVTLENFQTVRAIGEFLDRVRVA
jgi:acyl carrier protein